MIKTLKTWWTFTRPHTIIGSLLSITALYVISAAESAGQAETVAVSTLLQKHFFIYLVTLFSALTCNVFITGLNQWQDVEVDRINKPWLPLAAGSISIAQAIRVIFVCLALCLLSAATLGWRFFLLMLLICAIGAAYSLPPLKLKRHHLPAAFAIVTVRGLLVNLGMAAHYTWYMQGEFEIPLGVWPLALFTIGFSFGIAWFKDIPDTEGDERFQFKTLAVRRSRSTALWLGVAVVSIAYLVVSASPFVIPMLVNTNFFSPAHLFFCLLFIYRASKLRLGNAAAIKRFYLFFWSLFFAEYLIYPLAYLL
jgi:homogentisate phytyltransferase/homogentisate geranylgeranyltransferase